MPTTPTEISPRGELSEGALPRLLLDLHRSKYSGSLTISHQRSEKRFAFHQGAPVLAESNLKSETLGQQLVDQGKLAQADYDRVCAYMTDKQCREGVALLTLKLLQPKQLFIALKEQVRRRMLELFGWPAGSFVLDAEDLPDAEVQPFRVDPIELVQEGLETHWGANRILEDLARYTDLYPSPKRRFKTIARRLRSDDAVNALLAGFNGQRSLGQTLGTAINSQRALAAAWILSNSEAVRYVDHPTADRETGRTDFDADIEIELDPETAGSSAEHERVASKLSADALASQPAAPGAAARTSAKPKARAEEVRAEIERRCASLGDLGYYKLLGVEADANRGEIKKAYFKSAKLYHPDALARLGLEDLRAAAAAVFGRVAEAFEVLSNAEKRREYDANLADGAPQIDAGRVAQAENFYRKGEILVRMGDFKGALDFLKPAVDLWPEECAYQSALGWALYKKAPANIEAAKEHLTFATQLRPDDPVAHFRLGVVLRAAGDHAGAKKHLDTAKSLDSSVSET